MITRKCEPMMPGLKLKLAPLNQKDDLLSLTVATLVALLVYGVSLFIPAGITNMLTLLPPAVAFALTWGVVIGLLAVSFTMSLLLGSVSCSEVEKYKAVADSARKYKVIANAAVVYFNGLLVTLAFTTFFPTIASGVSFSLVTLAIIAPFYLFLLLPAYSRGA